LKIEIKTAHERVKIYFNGLLHLSIDITDGLSIQSWQEDWGMYYIEYYTKNVTILSHYDREECWIELLRQLDKII
jgi:hypothetical protein